MTKGPGRLCSRTVFQAMAAASPKNLLETLGRALLAGRHAEALSLAEAALGAGLEHPLPLRLLALARQDAGRFQDAVELHRRRLRLTPLDPAAWAELAQTLLMARRPADALDAYAQGLGRTPDACALLCGKARVLQSLSRIEEAEVLYARALALSPAAFEAGFGLAALKLESGDFDGAGIAAEELRARHGALPDLDWLEARAALGRGRAAQAREIAARRLQAPGLSAPQRADMLLLQGEAQDALGRPAEAFASACEGKAIQRWLYAERAAGRESYAGRCERLAAWFAAADPGLWRQAPEPSPVPEEAAAHAFILGFPRSGTTLLEQALAGHPEVVALEEAPTLQAAHAHFMSDAAGLERLARLSPVDAERWRASYWTEVKAQGVGVKGRLFIDKAPAETVSLPLIAKLFPQAKLLFALRDPRDVVLSCLRNGFQLNAMTYAFTRLDEAAAGYDRCMSLAAIYRRLLPLDLHEVRHERLVEDFETELAAIAAVLGLGMHPAMADVAATASRRRVRTPSAVQVRAGLSRQGLGRWRAYAEQMQPVQRTLAPWVKRFGYASG